MPTGNHLRDLVSAGFPVVLDVGEPRFGRINFDLLRSPVVCLDSITTSANGELSCVQTDFGASLVGTWESTHVIVRVKPRKLDPIPN
jgi:hypothetical protein